MRCLNDEEVQLVADGEAGQVAVEHVGVCALCRERVEARRGEMAALAALADDDLPAGAEFRLRQALNGGDAPHGATRLRTWPGGTKPRAVWSAIAAAAVIAVVVFLVLPHVGSPTTLSAREILGRSLKTLTGGAGVETLEYDLTLTGAESGAFRVVQLIDHDQPGRYKFSRYAADGTLISAIGQDAAEGRRFVMMRVDGRNYLVRLSSPAQLRLSLPDMMQAVMEMSITMMQSAADPKLTQVDDASGQRYVLEVPAVSPTGGAAGMFDLYSARAVIAARDYRIQQFQASGAILRQPCTVSFTLLRQFSRPSGSVPADEFDVAVGPTDVVLEGETGSDDPASEVLSTVLRALGRVRGH